MKLNILQTSNLESDFCLWREHWRYRVGFDTEVKVMHAQKWLYGLEHAMKRVTVLKMGQIKR